MENPDRFRFDQNKPHFCNTCKHAKKSFNLLYCVERRTSVTITDTCPKWKDEDDFDVEEPPMIYGVEADLD